MTRLYTEDVNRDIITSILDHYCEGYTLIPAIGAWKGKRESSLIIELFDTPSDVVERIAAEIASLNNQECVAVASLPASVSFIPAFNHAEVAA